MIKLHTVKFGALRKLSIVLLVTLLSFSWTKKIHAAELEDGLQTLWEVLWHPSGSPEILHRWGKQVRYRYFGVNLDFHRKHLDAILKQTSEITGVVFENVSDKPEAEKNAQLHIEIVANNGDIPENLACYVLAKEARNFQYENVQLRMRDRNVYACALHEMMHAMGLRGHPSGHTVLTYFNTRADKFLPIDEFLLRTWYSPQITSGMTPFHALNVLSDAWTERFRVARPDAEEVRQDFHREIMKNALQFVEAKGEPPRILLRSGTLNGAVVAQARIWMNNFLGHAYLNGHVFPQNNKEAEYWYANGAKQADPTSIYMIGFLNERRAHLSDSLERAYYWYTVGAAYKIPIAMTARNRLAAKLLPSDLSRLDAEAAAFKPE
jgi:hypothetical protein